MKKAEEILRKYIPLPKNEGEKNDDLFIVRAMQEYADQFRQAAVSGSLPLDVIKEAKYLLLIDGEGFCKDWKEGVGDCNKPACVFCRKKKLIETLERQ